MSDVKPPTFAELVELYKQHYGHEAPTIADKIIETFCPRTYRESVIEGVSRMLRDGIVAAVRRLLKGGDVEQRDFSDIDETFRPLAKELRTREYYVPSRGEFVDIKELIAKPPELDEARTYLRRKGEETLAQADILDRLAEAVMRKVRRDRRRRTILQPSEGRATP